MWLKKLLDYSEKSSNSFINPAPPVTKDELAAVHKALGEIPQELELLLCEFNGDGSVILSAEKMIETNFMRRALDYYMPLDCLLMFAENGCSDYYGFPIRKDGLRSYVYLWDHEFDSRTWIAGSLEQIMDKYCNGEI
jgi:hypothetical protein